jgi:hypothetical protein
MGWRQCQTRDLVEYCLRSKMEGMKLLDQYEAACKVRRLTRRTIRTTEGPKRTVLGTFSLGGHRADDLSHAHAADCNDAVGSPDGASRWLAKNARR